MGSLFRTCEGLGIGKLYLTGYTPYPLADGDERLPHLSKKISNQINKTALGAEKHLKWSGHQDINGLVNGLKKEGFSVLALEQSPQSKKLSDYKPTSKIALILGNEVDGVEPELLTTCDEILEIPMLGSKESFNVVQAAAMALYGLRYMV
ncbi:TrmH family RNA methyltransferase [Candidatus Saccharibacteria bacterium]|nr:TrmH family RNA methyltransferase [Candidatus Saccharibacteria bacterium]